MSPRSARLLALRRREWEWQDRQQGRGRPPRAWKYHAPRRVSPLGHRVRRRLHSRGQRPRPSGPVVRDALGAVALVCVATLLLYYVGTSAQ